MRTVLRGLLALALLVPVALVGAPASHAAPDNHPTFIITLNSGEPRAVAAEHARRHGAEITFVYEHALRGYAAKVSEGQIGALARDSRVARVERDGPVQASETDGTATWGLDRIDQRNLPTDGSYSWNPDGNGVNAYIIDTGIRIDHTDFGGRASFGVNTVSDGRTDDCNGHGTHVAGTVGGTEYGVAKKVNLVAVRVLDCKGSGTWSGVIAGIDWVTAHATQPAVANMSLGGGASSSVDAAVQNSIAEGISYAVAAGNGDRLGRAQDACNYSPARVPEAMTIGATTQSDAKTSWSNYGSCVDWFAPGYQITSAWYTSNVATNTISGTSMAAPHVAGAAALYLQANPGSTPLQVRDALYAATTKWIVTSSKTASNHLLYTGPPQSESGTTTNKAPTAAFTYVCTDLKCDFTDTSSDSDGTIASRSWAFGDSGASTATNPSHTYAAGGTYTVTLAVTDNGGATSKASKSVTVMAPGGVTLSVQGYKVSGRQRADLTWSGAVGDDVVVHRDGSVHTTTDNDGAHTDLINNRGGGSYTYMVCEAAPSTKCSGSVTVTF